MTTTPAAWFADVRRDRDRRRDIAALGTVTALSLLLNAWALDLNGLGNQYYAAATRSMIRSWHNFFFAAFDQHGFISVDKPPVALWIEATSARIFGYGTWSLLLPSAVAGAAAVAVMWKIIRPRFGRAAATIAALVLALSPVNVAVNRLNLPEPFLILFLVSAVWAVVRSFDSKHPYRLLIAGGVLMGLAFNTKMLAAFIPLPAIGIALLAGTRGWWARITRAIAFGATTVVVSLAWMVAVSLTPASARPYVGGSTDNSIWNLLFGYNGFGRVSGGGQGGVGTGGIGGAMSGLGGVFGGAAGPFRLLSDAVGGQIAWLLPVAVVGAGVAAWQYRRRRVERAVIALWVFWLAVVGYVFSTAEGTFHSYYTALLTPAIAGLVGIGSVAAISLARRHRAAWGAIAGTAIVTLALQLELVGREPSFYGWTRGLVIATATIAAVGVVAAFARRHARLLFASLAIGFGSLLIAPTAWASSETANAVLNATLPQAGARTGVAGSTFGSASSDGNADLAAFLRTHNTDGEAYDLVTASAQDASGLIADDDLSVMALGGFMGTDPATTVEQFAHLVSSGEVRYVLTTSTGMAGGMTAGGTASSILSTVESSCRIVTSSSLPTSYQGRIYDCKGATLTATT